MLEGAKPEGTSDVAYSRNQPPYWKITKNRSAATHGAINPAPATSGKRTTETLEPEENSRISTLPKGQMTPWNSADDGAGALFASARVQNRRREPAPMATQQSEARQFGARLEIPQILP
jgi:hypothetical protein